MFKSESHLAHALDQLARKMQLAQIGTNLPALQPEIMGPWQGTYLILTQPSFWGPAKTKNTCFAGQSCSSYFTKFLTLSRLPLQWRLNQSCQKR